MKAIKIRERLIEEINISKNESLLEQMYHLLNKDNNTEYYKLSKNQKEAIAEAKKQIENGQFFTNDQVNNEFEEWLKEK